MLSSVYTATNVCHVIFVPKKILNTDVVFSVKCFVYQELGRGTMLQARNSQV
jgi:hypothetical protein